MGLLWQRKGASEELPFAMKRTVSHHPSLAVKPFLSRSRHRTEVAYKYELLLLSVDFIPTIYFLLMGISKRTKMAP